MDDDTWTVNPGPEDSVEFREKFEGVLYALVGADATTARKLAADIFRMGYEVGYSARANQDDTD